MVRSDFKDVETLAPGRSGDSKYHVYILAVLAGIVLAVMVIGGLKLTALVLSTLFKFVKSYWIWIIVAIVGLLFLKKILSRKRVEVHREVPEVY